jgi:hypothetical protein
LHGSACRNHKYLILPGGGSALGSKSYRIGNTLHHKIIITVAILAVWVILLPLGFTATVNPTSEPGSMTTLQNIPATYAVSIVPGAAQRESLSSLSVWNL